MANENFKDVFDQKTDWRPGSMGEREWRTWKILRYVLAGVYLILILLFYVFNTDANFLQEKAGPVWGLIGMLFILLSYAVLYFHDGFSAWVKSAGWTAFIIVALLVLGLLTAIGFQGDLSGRVQPGQKTEVISSP